MDAVRKVLVGQVDGVCDRDRTRRRGGEGFDSRCGSRASTTSQRSARIVEGIPQKRFIQPSEIGTVAAFLCRDEAFALTMQDVTVSTGTLW